MADTPIMRFRSARRIAEYYKSKDKETAITENLIRKLMDTGELPIIQNGSKRVTSIEAVEAYINRQLEKEVRTNGNRR